MYNLYVAEKRDKTIELEEQERKKYIKYRKKFEIIIYINNYNIFKHLKKYRTNTNTI